MMYSIADIAKIFNVNHMTVRAWIDEGKIETIKVNNTIRITEPSFQKFLENAKHEAKK